MTADFKPYPFEFVRRTSPPPVQPEERHGVAIVGGGITGLTAALALAAQGVASVVIESDETVCHGSRAICFSRRTLEIFERIGVLAPVLAKGLPWEGGRSFHREREVLHFRMPHDGNQKLPPMVNLQQYYVEEYLVQAAMRHGALIDMRWGSRVKSAEPGDAERPARLRVEHSASGTGYGVSADYVICCDGGRSTMRDLLGLHLQGTAYEGRYVIADIELRSARPTERLAWFDPPSNPGSTILMHRQPDDIWRIDYQLSDEEDPEEAVRPENVLPRIRDHLALMGETGAWSPLWISVYKANALSLERYRHGRFFFAGDAAHLVPIFGVRGANSAIDDADNLAWKLALVVKGKADAALLDSYSSERVYAARENLANGMKSTEFMAPPTFAFRLMREAVLSLSAEAPALQALINPRQTTALRYADSPLNAPCDTAAFGSGPAAGSVLPSVPVTLLRPGLPEADAFISDQVAPGVCLVLEFCGNAGLAASCRRAVDRMRAAGMPVSLLPVLLHAPADAAATAVLIDRDGKAHEIYDAADGAVYLVRPDGHIAGRWRTPGPEAMDETLGEAMSEALNQAMRAVLGKPAAGPRIDTRSRRPA